MQGSVFGIYVCKEQGAPMQCVQAVEAVCGFGLLGDRYAGEAATDWARTRQVTLIALEDIQEANGDLPDGGKFTIAETRRNIVTVHVDLNALVGKEFRVGTVRMLGIEACTPCKRPSKLAGKDGFKERFAGRAGLRAAIMTSGTIRTGDTIQAAMPKD